MSHAVAIAENILLIVALPIIISNAARALVARIDNRGMFSIPFCRSLAVACGCVLAIATGVLAGLRHEFSFASFWDLSGFWHGPRFLAILERYAGDLGSISISSIAPNQLLFAQILLGAAALLAAVNSGIAVLGWRSLGALRGLFAHLVISLSVWLVLTVGVLAAIWVLHWLNFWILLVLLIVVEMRRREEGPTRLSF